MRVLFSLLLCLAFSTPATATLTQFTGKVISISDGDTITVITPDKQQVKIRLYGIACPKRGQAFGDRAKQATSDVVFKRIVTAQPIETDRHSRTVAIVYMPRGGSLNELLVREGLAWVYPQVCKRKDFCRPLKLLEDAARNAGRGLWADKEPVPPWLWRERRK